MYMELEWPLNGEASVPDFSGWFKSWNGVSHTVNMRFQEAKAAD